MEEVGKCGGKLIKYINPFNTHSENGYCALLLHQLLKIKSCYSSLEGYSYFALLNLCQKIKMILSQQFTLRSTDII